MKYCYLIFILIISNSICHSQSLKYTYDSQNRIKTVIFPNGNTENYYYDKVGNRINQVNIINNPTAVQNNNSVFEDFKVFPNPTDGLFNLSGKITGEAEFTLKLFDNTGKEIQSYVISKTNKFNQEFNIKELPSGSYHLTLSSNSSSRTWTIIKI